MKTQLNMKLQMNYLQKDDWAHLLKCWPAVNPLCKVLCIQQQYTKINTSVCGRKQVWSHAIHLQAWCDFFEFESNQGKQHKVSGTKSTQERYVKLCWKTDL